MRLPLYIALAASLAFPATAADVPVMTQTAPDKMPAGEYVNDQSHTSVTFRINHMGLSNYTARFKKVHVNLNYDPKDPTKSTLKVVIDTRSLETDFPFPEKEDFNKKLSEDPAFLNAGKYPEITFESTKIIKTGKNIAKVLGNMTMLGVTKPATLFVSFNGAYEKRPVVNDAAMGFSGTIGVKRSDFGFGTYIPVLGDDVETQIEIEFVKKT